MDAPHFCTGCGQQHGGHSGESDEVKIARINRDADVEIAKISRSEARQAIEAETEQTGIVADATVEAAVVEAEVLGDIVAPDPEPVPVVVETDPGPESIPEPEPEPAPEPPEIESAPEEEKSGGWWGSYR